MLAVVVLVLCGMYALAQGVLARQAAEDEDAADTCRDYALHGPKLLSLRRHPRERIAWLEAARDAAQSLADRKSEGVALGNLGLAYAALGQVREAIGDRHGAANHHFGLGLVLKGEDARRAGGWRVARPPRDESPG